MRGILFLAVPIAWEINVTRCGTWKHRRSRAFDTVVRCAPCSRSVSPHVWRDHQRSSPRNHAGDLHRLSRRCQTENYSDMAPCCQPLSADKRRLLGRRSDRGGEPWASLRAIEVAQRQACTEPVQRTSLYPTIPQAACTLNAQLWPQAIEISYILRRWLRG
jgi:hypothetical protein